MTWNWGTGEGHGKVARVHKDDVSQVIKGKKVTRHASAKKPALEIKTDKGAEVLKSVSEIKVK